MKQLITISFTFLTLILNSQIASFPYDENFDSFTDCIAFCEDICSLDNNWLNDTNDFTDWSVKSGPTGSSNTGPSGDHTSGTGKYVFFEATGCENSTLDLISPEFDFSSQTDLELSYWYHMLGGNMGFLSIDISTQGTSGPWTTIQAPFTDNIDLWQEQVIDLSAYNGESSIYIRFHFDGPTTPGFQSDAAIDDISIRASSLSINDNSFNNSITIESTVIENSLNISIKYLNSIDYTLYNILGQQQLKGQLIQGENIVDTSALSKGMYLLLINRNNQKETIKIIKK